MSTAQPNSPITIVIDPGHGGHGPVGRSSAYGTRGPRGTLEKDVMLDLARRVAGHLGPGVALTRDRDENLSLGARCAVARRNSARVFLSLHANEGPPGSRGSEIFVHPQANQRSHAFADALQRELGHFGNPVAGKRSAGLAVLTPERLGPDTAACFVEVDYLSTPDGERHLRDGQSLDRLGSSIARGVSRFLGGAGGEHRQTTPGRHPLARAQEDAPQGGAERDPAKGFWEIIGDESIAVPPSAPGVDGYVQGLEGGPVDTIVNIAKTAWDVMKDNRPVANATSDFATAIPQGAGLAELVGWVDKPRFFTLHYHSANPAGWNATDIYLRVSWFFNGSFNGAGQYINAATVIATGSPGWGNTINVVASINNPMNLGTREAPIAALPIRIRLTESNFMQSDTYAYEGVVQGNGAYRMESV